MLVIALMLALAMAVPAFAITEAEVEEQVNQVGKETVTGNVLIWFLCAVAFLKVSQKIDSFMASLGVNVGHTGGSMLAEAMIATKSIASVAGIFGGAGGRRASGGPGNDSTNGLGFLKGGLAGVVSRKVTNDAVKTATSNTSAVGTIKSKTSETSAHTSKVTGQQDVRSSTKQQTDSASRVKSHIEQASSVASRTTKSDEFKGTGLGGAVFARSLRSGGRFANEVIGSVACGNVRSSGAIKGDMAIQSLMSYMGYTALGEDAKDVPTFSDVEIGGGRITGIETAPGSSEGLAFGMYNAEQYTAPQGDFTKVHSADGTLWYKQYAQDAVERKPYMAPDDTVAYHESIVKKLPDPPRRKDRL